MNRSSSQLALLAWYRTHGRHDLPWRNTRDAYAIYVSEVMLQQTQVKTVLEKYYTPFLGRFPSLKLLADAPQQEVLKAWQGLGYYRRALNLHAAAKQCQGELPRDIQSLLALPGIGQNTAHAIAAFAYGAKVPVMEANVKRVLARLFALTNPSDAQLWQHAHTLIEGVRDSFSYNQAMMDLGALVCTPKAPKCKACPVAKLCQGKQNPCAFPAKKTSKSVPIRRRTIILARHNNKLYMAPRGGKHLGALYQFLEVEGDVEAITLNGKKYSLSGLLCANIVHHYSHYTLHAKVVTLALSKDFKPLTSRWYTPAQVEKLPVSKLELLALSRVDCHDTHC